LDAPGSVNDHFVGDQNQGIETPAGRDRIAPEIEKSARNPPLRIRMTLATTSHDRQPQYSPAGECQPCGTGNQNRLTLR
jgi:hypothetical protein